MVTERQIPDFPSRRSLHAKGADPHALDEATAMASLPSRTDLPPVPETPPAPETLPAADSHSAVDSGVAVKTGAVGGTDTGEVLPEAEASSARENEVAAPIPERRSMRDRLANTPPVNLDPPSTPLLGVPVGHGAVAAPGDSFVEGMTGAYTMLTEGVFNDELAGTGLVPVVDVISSGSLLDAEKATTHTSLL